MQVLTSDKIGLVKYVQCKRKSSIYEQTMDPHLNKMINGMTWSGRYGGYEETEITLWRKNGLVESFEINNNENDFHISNVPSLSFLSCNNCIYGKMLNHHHNIIYEDVFNKNKKIYKNYSNFLPAYTNETTKNGIYKNYLQNSRILVTVNNNGHVSLLNWDQTYDNCKYLLENNDEIKYNNDMEKKINVYFKNYKQNVLNNIEFKQIDDKNQNKITIKNNQYQNIHIENICKTYHYNNMISKENILQSYILATPIDAATTNEILTNRLAIGGYKNNLKIFDLFTGTYLWKSKPLGPTLLNINCESLIKSITYLNKINVNIVACSTYDHKIILYDIRCQNKPVYVYDHYKTKNVDQNKYNYFDHNYSESDLIFTSICTESHITIDHMNQPIVEPIDTSGLTNELGNSNANTTDIVSFPIPEKTQNHQNQAYKKFTTNDIKLANIKACDNMNHEKQNEKEPSKNTNEEQCNTYFIKPFDESDNQFIMVSDNYGNIYEFEIITGLKLLNYIYIKKMAYEKNNYKDDEQKKKISHDEYLIQNKDKLYEFYKEYQKNNKTHMRNDLPVMWAKNNFQQFIINFVKKYRIHNGAISSLSLHKDGKYLCSASYERFINILNLKSKKVIKRIHVGHIPTSCLFLSKIITKNDNETEDNKSDIQNEFESSSIVTEWSDKDEEDNLERKTKKRKIKDEDDEDEDDEDEDDEDEDDEDEDDEDEDDEDEDDEDEEDEDEEDEDEEDEDEEDEDEDDEDEEGEEEEEDDDE
ncbi:conserved Plasmodium protein, unknown function [Plasmodium berghei]|uniref:Uncharacterized protein n=2 Tax=Plasmodium berghei TaxID=5821 RepID=A0A509AG41_PLABA|nr:conserved protein, unknown function [Plasmodium berghei ANKA]SCM20014.1 conserved Plasmodium protein, unknown function [Plasmodium berghei]SCN23700.1 conserved Plasmodium protein, unknown function [Plasmodium berghei]SCO60027.1 conserved Plasmodium protein, unknown function [Plasmodium berghei]VUC54903.1 conserved protein, unknown function [Plasmodium berghei ANKA]|eukprot:XP_034420728.1 conserved protein, unknown function [Plasmodium berghei ANKA]